MNKENCALKLVDETKCMFAGMRCSVGWYKQTAIRVLPAYTIRIDDYDDDGASQ